MPTKREKGGEYEREVCRTLTAWWTGDPARDVLFWRTAGSGGRATNRSRRGKRTTAAHVGDIAAIEPAGEPLTRLIAWEMKRGYWDATPGNLLDRPQDEGRTEWEGFIVQAMTAAANSGAPFWALVQRRNRKEEIVYVPAGLVRELRVANALDPLPRPLMKIRLAIPAKGKDQGMHATVYGMTLTAFLDGVRPADIRAVLGRLT